MSSQTETTGLRRQAYDANYEFPLKHRGDLTHSILRRAGITSAEVTRVLGDGQCFWWAVFRAVYWDKGPPLSTRTTPDNDVYTPEFPRTRVGDETKLTAMCGAFKERIYEYWKETVEPWVVGHRDLAGNIEDGQLDDTIAEYADIDWSMVVAAYFQKPVWVLSSGYSIAYMPITGLAPPPDINQEYARNLEDGYTDDEPIVIIHTGDTRIPDHYDIVTGYGRAPDWNEITRGIFGEDLSPSNVKSVAALSRERGDDTLSSSAPSDSPSEPEITLYSEELEASEATLTTDGNYTPAGRVKRLTYQNKPNETKHVFKQVSESNSAYACKGMIEQDFRPRDRIYYDILYVSPGENAGFGIFLKDDAWRKTRGAEDYPRICQIQGHYIVVDALLDDIVYFRDPWNATVRNIRYDYLAKLAGNEAPLDGVCIKPPGDFVQ